MKTKFALVLSGGGFNGAFQVGAIKYISQNWKKITGLETPMKFDIISGVSAGAINGALVAMNELQLLHNLWMNQIAKGGASEIYTSPFIDTDSKANTLQFKFDLLKLAKQLNIKFDINDLNFGIGDFVSMLYSNQSREEFLKRSYAVIEREVKNKIHNLRSIADSTPLREKLTSCLDQDKIQGTTFSCGFVSLDSGTYHSVCHNQFLSNLDFIKGVLSSASIPGIFQPVDQVMFLENCNLKIAKNNVDGGIVNASPLGDAVKLIQNDTEDCVYKIFVINCNNGFVLPESFSNTSMGAVVARSIYELTLNEIFKNDIDQFLQINDLAKQVQSFDSKLVLKTCENKSIKAFQAVVINPDNKVHLGSPLVANQELIYNRLVHGYDQAKKFLNP